MGFTHLHVHTEYSLLDGASKIGELVHHTKELGMDSIAITDHGVMYGVIDFYKAAKAEGIKPIIGCEVYVAPGSRFDREAGRSEERYYHLVLLAENDLGYHNLMKIVSRGFTEGYYYKPRVDKEILQTYHEGIIALSACLAGEVALRLQQGLYDEAKKAALQYAEIFGRDNFFLELQDHGIDAQKTVNQGILRLSRDTGLGMVVTNDIHYVRESDAEAHDILLCIQTGKKVADEDRMRYEGGQYYLKSPEEMEALFPYAKEALENTAKIAERCNVEIRFGEQKVPQFDVPEGYTAETYLRKLCEEGLVRRYGQENASAAEGSGHCGNGKDTEANPGAGTEPIGDDGTDSGTEEDGHVSGMERVPAHLRERLAYELDTIRNMGYVDYFLIVWDFIKYARDHGIAVGPGRGSAAGSIVSYCLGITNIDPIRFQLLFERFLNPERVTMPDIDVDFCYERRQEVIDYVVRKYGKEKVVQIVTFGTMAARMVIRDVGRVLDMPYAAVDRVAKMIPMGGQNLHITIEDALKSSPDFKKAYEEEEEVRYLVDMAKKLEGLPRHASMHAAGVVIGQKPIDEFVPLSRGSEDAITTQFTMTTIEELGLLKMDFLGLRTLTVIQDAIRNIEKSRGIRMDVDHLNMEDPEVYDLICTGQTEGIFQLESGGMRGFMTQLKPRNIEDIIAGISLYRPGPMDFIPMYIRGKEHPEAVTYDCPQLEKILSPTYGCIVYQEQVMQIVMELAGYTMGRSDLVRRAMSKKKESVMQKERKNFVYGNPEEGVPGCISRGISEEIANKIFDEMTDFAKYAFNKSHAAAYAVVAYQTAYLKCHYPAEFMAALITSVLDRTDKVSEYIAHCKKIGIRVLPPDINEGVSGFSVSDGAIRYGLSALKSVGRPVIHAVVEEREKNGPYRDLRDFVDRLNGKDVNRRTVESLIKAGAFDCFPANRRQMLLVYEQVMDSVNREKKSRMGGQLSLFDFMGDEEKEFAISYPKVEDFSKEEKLAYEKEVLGTYVSGHPLEEDMERMKKQVTATTLDFVADPEAEISEAGISEAGISEAGIPVAKDQEYYVMGGMVTAFQLRVTKKGENMAILTLEDLFGTVEVVVFPSQFEKYRGILLPDAKVFVAGRAAINEKEHKLILDQAVPFSEVPQTVYLQCENKEDYQNKEADIYGIVRRNGGKCQVQVRLKAERQMKPLGELYGVDASPETLQEFKDLLGEGKVVLQEEKLALGRRRR